MECQAGELQQNGDVLYRFQLLAHLSFGLLEANSLLCFKIHPYALPNSHEGFKSDAKVQSA